MASHAGGDGGVDAAGAPQAGGSEGAGGSPGRADGAGGGGGTAGGGTAGAGGGTAGGGGGTAGAGDGGAGAGAGASGGGGEVLSAGGANGGGGGAGGRLDEPGGDGANGDGGAGASTAGASGVRASSDEPSTASAACSPEWLPLAGANSPDDDSPMLTPVGSGAPAGASATETGSGDPQFMQNFEPASLSVPHAAHCIDQLPSPWGRCTEMVRDRGTARRECVPRPWCAQSAGGSSAAASRARP